MWELYPLPDDEGDNSFKAEIARGFAVGATIGGVMAAIAFLCRWMS
jgi:hypothetical protein